MFLGLSGIRICNVKLFDQMRTRIYTTGTNFTYIKIIILNSKNDIIDNRLSEQRQFT